MFQTFPNANPSSPWRNAEGVANIPEQNKEYKSVLIKLMLHVPYFK